MSVLVALQSGAAFTSEATFDQAPAGWAATAEETFASTATFTQATATWAAIAAEAFAATGSFDQAAAAWSAIAAETFASTGAFVQAAAEWSAVADTPAASSFTATFDQLAAVWDASLSVPDMGGRHAVGLIRLRRSETTFVPSHSLIASFSQEPPGWVARTAVTDDELVLALA